jgi:hypothetical protein
MAELDGSAQGRVAALSPAKRALLEARLRGERPRLTSQGPSRSIVRRPAEQPQPLSFAQARLFRRMKTEPEAARNHFFLVELRGSLDVQVLQRALLEMVRRHENLRTRFESSTDMTAALVSADAILDFQVWDLGESGADALAEAVASGNREGQAPYDLSNGPLVRVRLQRLAADHHVLLLGIHLIVFDVWSMGVVIQELSALYSAFAEGRSSPLPDLAYQYGDFAYSQHLWHKDGWLEPQVAYWREELSGASSDLSLPMRSPSAGPFSPFAQAMLPIALSPGLWSEVLTFSRSRDASPYMTLLAAFDLLLFKLTGQTEFLVGTPVANRNQPGVEGLIGYFPNVLPIRARLASSLTFDALVLQLRHATLRAYANQDLPFDRYLSEVMPLHPPGVPLTRVLFSAQNTPMPPLRLGTVEARPLVLDYGVMAPFDLTVLLIYSSVILDGKGGIAGMLHYNANLFERSAVESLWERYQELLQVALTNSGTVLDDFRVDPRDAVSINQPRTGVDEWP